MSLISRCVHYPRYNLCFCFFLRPFKQQQQHQGRIFLCFVNMERKENNRKREYLLQILKDVALVAYERRQKRVEEESDGDFCVVRRKFIKLLRKFHRSDGGGFDFVEVI
jgi:chloramphenicol O-acetyltransferase